MKAPLLAVACLGWAAAGVFAAAPVAPLHPADSPDSLDGARGFTHLAFVIDTSGSMRDVSRGRVWPMVARTVENVLAAHPETKWIQWIDSKGLRQLGARDEWVPCDRSNLESMMLMLERSRQDGISDPVLGILKALTLPLPKAVHEQIHICVIGDESTADPDKAWRAIAQANPVDGYGGWRATISAVQLPTTLRFGGGSQNTGVKFEALMTDVAKRYGGTFRLLAGVDRP